MKGSTIYDKKSRRWYVSIYWEGKRYKIFRHPLTGDPFWSEKSAEKQLGKLRTEVDEKTFNPATWFPDSPLSLRVYALNWLEIIEVSEKTRRDYTGYFRNWIIPFFKDMDIRSIRYNKILELHKNILLSDKSRYNIVSCLK